MISPETYADQKTPKQLEFFNYHEYLVSEYTPIQPLCNDPGSQGNNESSQRALVINHFSNPYTKQDGEVFSRTRIVRIPRTYDTCEESYMVPQFSSYIPGHEPAALFSDSISQFRVEGTFRGYAFGYASLTPLVPQWLLESEFVDVVSTINKLILEFASPKNKGTWLENALDFFSGTFYSTFCTKIVDSSYKRGLKTVDEYVESVNVSLGRKHPDLKIIPLSKSGMLSLDIQIPMEPGCRENHRRH